MKYKAIEKFIDQDTKKEVLPGEFWTPSSDFEKGRHLAEQNVIPVVNDRTERAVRAPTETRKKRGRPRKRKNDTTANNAGNG